MPIRVAVRLMERIFLAYTITLSKNSEGTEAIFTATLRTGAVSTDVQNLSGTELPATGGIGTKIFYTVGAIIMIVAAVLLITRKRTAKN